MGYLDDAEALRDDLVRLIRVHYEGTDADFSICCDEIAESLRSERDGDAADLADYILAVAHGRSSQVVGM